MKAQLKYTGAALPVIGTTTLFNSATMMGGVGGFALLNLQWYQWALFQNSGGASTAVVTVQYLAEDGTTWITFYTSNTVAANTEMADEVYVGIHKNIRVQLTIAAVNTTAFRYSHCFNDQKASSENISTARLNVTPT